MLPKIPRSGRKKIRNGRLLMEKQNRSLIHLLLLTLLFYAVVIGLVVHHYQWNVSALFVLGSAPYSDVDLQIHSPGEDIVVYEDGAYDGQYTYWVARSPFVVQDFVGPYRYQRIIYPVFAYLLAGRQAGLLPYTLLLANLIFLFGGTYIVGWHLKDRGLSPWWAIVFPLNVGMMSCVLTTLTEPSFLFFSALAFVFWVRKRHGWGAFFLAVAMLAREITILFILPLFVWCLWHRRWRSALYLCLTAIPFAAYQYNLYLQTGQCLLLASTERNLGLPLMGIIEMAAQLPKYAHQGFYGLLKYINFIPIVILLGYLAYEGAIQLYKQIKEKWNLRPFTLLLWAQIMLGSMIYVGGWESITGMGRVISGIFLLLPFAWSEEEWNQRWGLTLVTLLLTAMGIARLFIAHPHPYHIT